MLNKTIIIPVVITTLVASSSGFYGGIKYQEAESPQRMTFQAGQGGNRMIQGGQRVIEGNTNSQKFQGFRPVLGEIINHDDKTITVKMEDGSSRIINISDTTTINKSFDGSRSDLTTGQKVNVFGTENSDGSITATNVQLNPQTRTIQNETK